MSFRGVHISCSREGELFIKSKPNIEDKVKNNKTTIQKIFTVLEFDSTLSIVPILVNMRSTTLRVAKRAGT